MEVTVASGSVTVDPDNGIAAPVVLNASTIIRFEPINGSKYTMGASTADLFITNPPTKTDEWKVVVVMNDRQIEPLVLSRITNQPTWTNNLAGATNAVNALAAAFA